MATYIMFGKLSFDAMNAISAERTDKAIALIKENGGELKAAYALLGDTDYVVILDLPDTERAMKTSIGLSRLLGVSFSTLPAVNIDVFDKLMR